MKKFIICFAVVIVSASKGKAKAEKVSNLVCRNDHSAKTEVVVVVNSSGKKQKSQND